MPLSSSSQRPSPSVLQSVSRRAFVCRPSSVGCPSVCPSVRPSVLSRPSAVRPCVHLSVRLSYVDRPLSVRLPVCSFVRLRSRPSAPFLLGPVDSLFNFIFILSPFGLNLASFCSLWFPCGFLLTRFSSFYRAFLPPGLSRAPPPIKKKTRKKYTNEII